MLRTETVKDSLILKCSCDRALALASSQSDGPLGSLDLMAFELISMLVTSLSS